MKDAYEKILRSIKSSTNQMHLTTCAVMIGIFNMQYDSKVLELDLKEEHDKRAQELGLLII